jgi:hypothetical protein
MTIAEAMLELLDSPEKWVKGVMREGGMGDDFRVTVVRRCLAGARCDAVPETQGIRTSNQAGVILETDPVILGLARIIEEQYPEVCRIYPTATAVGRITGFNDIGATGYEDVRAVLEKAIAEGL